MKIAVVHPIRHHAYYALQGALNVDATAENARKSAEYYSWDRYAEGVAGILQEMEDVRSCGQEGV